MSQILQTPEQSGSTRELLVVAVLATLALSVRMVFFSQWAGKPPFLIPMGDELNFHQTALALLGQGDQLPAFLYQPLYSFFLAVFYGLVGVSVSAVKSFQLVLGVGTVLVFYGLARSLAGRRAAWVAAGLAALYGPQVFFEGQLLAPVLCVPLTAGAFWCLLVARQGRRLFLAGLAGLLLGLALMGRPNLGVIVPLLGVWLLIPARTARPGRLRARLAAAACWRPGWRPAWPRPGSTTGIAPALW